MRIKHKGAYRKPGRYLAIIPCNFEYGDSPVGRPRPPVKARGLGELQRQKRHIAKLEKDVALRLATLASISIRPS